MGGICGRRRSRRGEEVVSVMVREKVTIRGRGGDTEVSSGVCVT